MEVYSASHQTMSSLLENGISCSVNAEQEEHQPEKKLRPTTNREQSLRCPRCDSSNTKFCYYNNYSLSQPRYFCKACRRYWTHGGSLRNVPVGGGCRKNRRSSSSSLTTTSSKNSQIEHHEDDHITKPKSLLPALPLPPLSYDPNELSLAFATLQHHPVLDCQDNTFLVANPNPNPAPGFLDILRSSSCSGLYYGLGAVGEVEGGGGSGVLMLPYDGGLMSSTEAVTTTTTTTTATAATATTSQGSMDEEADQDNKLVMGLHHYQWPVGRNHIPANANANANFGMDPVRDYWNNGVGSSWPWTHQQLPHLGFS